MEETGLYGEPGLRFGIKDAGIVAPGAPDRSIILVRMGRTGVSHSRDLSLLPDWTFAMPPLASNAVDEAGLELIRQRIDSLDDAESE